MAECCCGSFCFAGELAKFAKPGELQSYDKLNYLANLHFITLMRCFIKLANLANFNFFLLFAQLFAVEEQVRQTTWVS